MVDQICQSDVEIDLNNNLVNETENLEVVLMNEELHEKKLDESISSNDLLNRSLLDSMAIPVVDILREGYKIRKDFG